MTNTRHTVDTITPEALEQLYAELDQTKRDYKALQLGSGETISYWQSQTADAREYSVRRDRAYASTVLEARRQAARARDYEASAKRLHAECLRANRFARSAAKDAKDALIRQLAVEDAINRGLYVAEVIDANGIAWAASSIRKALAVEADR
jgi:hypothetical protein